MGASKLMTFGV